MTMPESDYQRFLRLQPHREAFGARVRAWRGERTQVEVCGRLGVRQTVLSEIESGTHYLTPQIRARIERVIGG